MGPGVSECCDTQPLELMIYSDYSVLIAHRPHASANIKKSRV